MTAPVLVLLGATASVSEGHGGVAAGSVALALFVPLKDGVQDYEEKSYGDRNHNRQYLGSPLVRLEAEADGTQVSAL